MGYTKMNRHNYPDIEGLTEVERAKLDHIDDIEDDLADAYDSTATYAVGDWCIRNGKLYECITAIATAEPFDSTKWQRVTVAELKSNLTDLLNPTETELTATNWNLRVSRIGKLVMLRGNIKYTGTTDVTISGIPAPTTGTINSNHSCAVRSNADGKHIIISVFKDQISFYQSGAVTNTLYQINTTYRTTDD